MTSSEPHGGLAFGKINRIPVARTLLADTETPLSVYLKLGNKPYSFLFESVQGGEKWGRYSIIGLPATRWFEVSGNSIRYFEHGQLSQSLEDSDPLALIDATVAKFNSTTIEGLPVFHGGLVGYFGYDTVRFIEPKLRNSCPPDALNCPDILLMLTEEVAVFDNLAGTITLVVNADTSLDNAQSLAQARLDELESQLLSEVGTLEPITLGTASTAAIESQASFETSQDTFEHWVARVREYILSGDVMQVVPSQRMSVPYHHQPLSLYRALRNLNPSPYMYFLDLGDFHIVGSSPEILVRAEQGLVTVRPIAGTRPRGRNEQEDAQLAAGLLADAKEIAEHLMLIDLGRNDVGKIAEPGSVNLTENMVIERYSHVMHIVSNVEGRAKAGTTAMDALRAALPAGTLSGAPKVRAMEIIDELEPTKRGIYGGAIGYISWAGDMDTAIAIRTAVVKDNTVYIQAGAGIVADSVPAAEWEETLNKARAMLRAVAMVQQPNLDR